MTLNPQERIPDHLDTVLPSGWTVREAANARRFQGTRYPSGSVWSWLVFLFDWRRPWR